MNVPTIQVSRSEALTKIRDYQALNKSQKTREDERLETLYKSVKNGGRVINIAEAFKATGLNDKGQPKLAIARADWNRVWFHPRCLIEVGDRNYNWSAWAEGAGAFVDCRDFKPHSYAKTYSVPRGTFDSKLAINVLHSPVPHIPPKLRPTIHLRNFHILFEVEKWNTYPVDPFLLRHIVGHIFVVVGEWELTPLEASLLGGMTTGN